VPLRSAFSSSRSLTISFTSAVGMGGSGWKRIRFPSPRSTASARRRAHRGRPRWREQAAVVLVRGAGDEEPALVLERPHLVADRLGRLGAAALIVRRSFSRAARGSSGKEASSPRRWWAPPHSGSPSLMDDLQGCGHEPADLLLARSDAGGRPEVPCRICK
jgi:hypothetical protein